MNRCRGRFPVCLRWLVFYTRLKAALSGVSCDIPSRLRHGPVSPQTARGADAGWRARALTAGL